jgi:hypothetical protein
MVNKKTIGKIQLFIGILLLIGSILAMVYLNLVNNRETEVNAGNFVGNVKSLQVQNFTNETKSIIFTNIALQYQIEDSYIKSKLLMTELSLLLIFFISLFFIMEGLTNKAK